MARGKLKIYGYHGSGNCLKVRWLAEQVRMPFDWIETDPIVGETRTPEFLAINPAGQVPCAILPDGRMLAQSNAIMLHLAETHGSDLIPKDPYDRAKMMEWLFWEQYSHETAIAVRRALKKFRHKTDEELDPALLTKGRAALARMELALGDSDFLVGDRVSLADVALVAYTRVAHEGGFDLNEFPAVKSWVARVENALGIPHALEAA